ncbi:unnamed protein product [Amoebophrya sp. A120]|nr:unnamed protein product [Amoebophrya sp. A120]|eukprot:GSA120T00011383001.1
MSGSSSQLVRSWNSLARIVASAYQVPDGVNGTTNAHATARLFGQKQPRVVLFRDNHAWCPYCQKVWLWLEEKRVPYEVRKVTMFCYGAKEPWYKKIVPSGMLPALAFVDVSDAKKITHLVTDSDDVLQELEEEFGALNNASLTSPAIIACRKLERMLFRAWCDWLCNPYAPDREARQNFQGVCGKVEAHMAKSNGPYFAGDSFTVADCVIAPFLERMCASLYYYKGFQLRKEHPILDKWCSAMETREVYRGTKSDFHTHVHDLPPQLGGCHPNANAKIHPVNGAASDADAIPEGVEVRSDCFPEPADVRLEILYRVLRHREKVAGANPYGKSEAFDLAMRAVLSRLVEEHAAREPCQQIVDLIRERDPEAVQIDRLPPNSARALRYVRDRVSIPRDMSFWAGRKFRHALEQVARDLGNPEETCEHPIPVEHRRDTDPKRFRVSVSVM